jgi:hypothetical protein
MTISIAASGETIIAADNISYVKATAANNDIVAVAYDNNNGVDLTESNYILYDRSTNTAGSPVQLNDDNPNASYPAIGLVYERIEDDRILTFHNNDTESGGYGRVVTNSGTTPAAQPDTRFHESVTDTTDHVRGDDTVAGKHSTLATGVLAYRIGDDADFGYYQAFTVASGNVSFGTAVQMAVDNPAPLQLDLKHWTGNKYANTAYVNGLNIRILDTTSGITEYDLEEEGTYSNVNWVALCKIDESRMLCFFFDETGNDFYAVVATLFATSQVIWGTPLSINANSPDSSKGTNILNRGANKFTFGYPTNSTDWKFESVSVSGSTITKLNDDDTVTLGGVSNVQLVGFDGTEGALVYIDDTLEEIQLRDVTSLPGISYGFTHSQDGIPGLIMESA